MADNVTLLDSSLVAFKVAADEVSFSSDTTKVQLNRLVHVAGAEGSKTLADLSDVTGLFVHPQPATSGGCSNDHTVAAATTNAKNIKASAGQLFGVHIFNNAAYPVYVKIHNTASTPTAGAGVIQTIGCQAGESRDVVFPLGKAYATGIGITIVKGITDADTTAVALSDCTVDIDFK